MKFHSALIITLSLLFFLAATTKSQDFPVGSCGDQADGALCAEGFCCSKWGWCGNTTAYCSPENCQSQCPPPPSPPPPPPSPEGPIQCGIQHGGAKCPASMCCTIMGYCANSRGPQCSVELCQSQCVFTPTCGVHGGSIPCMKNQCCTKAGFCAPFTAPSCMPPFCQSQCYFGKPEPRISMLKKVIELVD